MNDCKFCGRLTYDPEVRNTPTGKKVCNFTVAVNEGKDRVEFIDCVAWDDRAERISQYFKKGKPIIVHCSHQTDRWEDKESGEARRSVKYRVNNFNFVPGSPKSDDVQSETGSNNSTNESTTEEDEEEVPF